MVTFYTLWNAQSQIYIMIVWSLHKYYACNFPPIYTTCNVTSNVMFHEKTRFMNMLKFQISISHFYYRRITNHFFAFFTMIDVVPRWYLTSPLWWFSLNLAKCHSITNWSNNINTITSQQDNPIHLHTW